MIRCCWRRFFSHGDDNRIAVVEAYAAGMSEAEFGKAK